MSKNRNLKKAISFEGVLTLTVIFLFFYYFSKEMGTLNLFNTLMATAHDLLINTVFFIMALAVLAGALSSVFSEFGVISILNKILSPLMKPLYNLPGAAVLGVITTYFSDNPAIITLSKDRGFKRCFKKYQLPALTNLGTAFGMGLIVTTFMIAQSPKDGTSFVSAALIGNLGAVIGSIISVRLMLIFTKKHYGMEEAASSSEEIDFDYINYREVKDGHVGFRLLESMLEGGKNGVEMGLAIIPGVLVICTVILLMTNGTTEAGIYTGAAYEGVPILPWIGNKLSFIIKPLLGFEHSEAIAFPITALGAVGAALSVVPQLLEKNLIAGNEIAVFTAMGMCWSGYLSTHVAMMDNLKARDLTGKAILCHTIGGLMAGISAHFLYILFL